MSGRKAEGLAKARLFLWTNVNNLSTFTEAHLDK